MVISTVEKNRKSETLKKFQRIIEKKFAIVNILISIDIIEKMTVKQRVESVGINLEAI